MTLLSRQTNLRLAAWLTLCSCSARLMSAEVTPSGTNSTEAAPNPASVPEAANQHFLPDFANYRSSMSSLGMEYSVLYIGETLANVSGGRDRGVVYEGLLKTQLDFDLEKLSLWKSGRVHLSGLYPHGEGPTGKYLGDRFTLSNIDAPDSVRLFEFWYEHQLVPDLLSFRVGQLAADEEFAFTGYGSTFIDGTVGWPAIIALNAPTPAYPVATPGARLAFGIGKGWSLQTAVYNGNPCPTDDLGNDLNKHGVYWEFRDVFWITELKKTWDLNADRLKLGGISKLGAWYHSGNFDHQRLDDLGLSLASPTSTGNAAQLHGNWGLYLAAEQQLWRADPSSSNPSRALGAFARFGGSPPDRNLLQFYAEGGLCYTGFLPGRPDDTVGLAVVYGRISREAKQLVHECNQFIDEHNPLPDFEIVVEATYTAVLTRGLRAQPVFAYVIHPAGVPGGNAAVLGLRMTLDL